MAYDPQDTIAAIATAAGGAARGVLRISGVRVADVLTDIFTSCASQSLDAISTPSTIAGELAWQSHEHSTGERCFQLPCQLFFWPNTRSYTREPVAELHTIGSPPLLDSLLAAVCQAGARLAEPGEFTLRAFLAGRIDLSQAEAVLGVIDAEDSGQLETALSQLAGGIGEPLDGLRNNLLQLLAELEAGLDFVEEDIEFITQDEIVRRLTEAEKALEYIQQQMSSRSSGTDLPQIVLAGPSNAGKSSLFNALIARYAGKVNPTVRTAITSPEKGTTRDYLAAKIELDGVVCELIDTAGIDGRTAAHPIELQAQMHATEQQRRATVRLFCAEQSKPPECDGFVPNQDLLVATKIDLSESGIGKCVIATSSHTGQGIKGLAAAIRSRLIRNQPSSVVATTALRCRDCLRLATESLARSVRLAKEQSGEELIATEIRQALNELGKVVGAIYTDDILDRIFSGFCIGK